MTEEKTEQENQESLGQNLKNSLEKAFETLDALIQKMMSSDKLSGARPSLAKRALIPIRNILFTHEMQMAAMGDALRQISITVHLLTETLHQKSFLSAEDIQLTAQKMGLVKVDPTEKKKEETKIGEVLPSSEAPPECPSIEPLQTAETDPIQNEPNSSDSLG